MHCGLDTVALCRTLTALNQASDLAAVVRFVAEQVGGKGDDGSDCVLDRVPDPAAVVLGLVEDGEVRLTAGVSKHLAGCVKAGDLVRFVAEQVGSKGGDAPAKLAAALDRVFASVLASMPGLISNCVCTQACAFLIYMSLI